MAPENTAALVDSILKPGWWVRHYWRGARGATQRDQRAAAIRSLGLAVRAAFNASDDFEPLLTAVVDALVPREPRF